MVKFKTTKAERELIDRIVARTMQLAKSIDVKYSEIDCAMDIKACHCNGMKLDLKRLLSFPDFDFSHDVFGIRRYINRNNGQITDCFVPRCARGELTPNARKG